MIGVKQLTRWLDTLGEDSGVAFDEGGLTLIEVDAEEKPTGAYLEIGGASDEEE